MGMVSRAQHGPTKPRAVRHQRGALPPGTSKHARMQRDNVRVGHKPTQTREKPNQAIGGIFNTPADPFFGQMSAPEGHQLTRLFAARTRALSRKSLRDGSPLTKFRSLSGFGPPRMANFPGATERSARRGPVNPH